MVYENSLPAAYLIYSQFSIYEIVSIIFGTGATICTSVVVARRNSKW
jgi:hypothetical protein